MNNEIRTNNILFGVFLTFLIIIFSLSIAEQPGKRYVLLSFDIEPVDNDSAVLDVLDVLYRNNVSATFFVTGEYMEQHTEITGFLAGGEIACHGYTHEPVTQMDPERLGAELQRCREIVKNITGQEAVGFRAPYNRIDGDALAVVEREGFLYDASMVKSWGPVYPDLDKFSIGEIPVSSIFGLPLEDVVWTYYLRMPNAYFYILRNKKSPVESYLFHPHHIAGYKKELDALIKGLKAQNAIFISHSELIKSHEGV